MPPCWYKGLLVIERYFRSPKRIQIKMMPINHWASRRVKAHVKIYVLVLMVERVAELESGLPWHRIRRSLDKLPVKKLCKLNYRVFMCNEISAKTGNMLKLHKINAPQQVLSLENQLKTVRSEESEEGEQHPGDRVVLGSGGKSQIRPAVHRRDQEQAYDPADAQQSKNKKPYGAGDRFAVVEAMAADEAEDPQNVADGFAVGVGLCHEVFSFYCSVAVPFHPHPTEVEKRFRKAQSPHTHSG